MGLVARAAGWWRERRPPGRPPAVARIVVQGLPIHEQVKRIGGGLTPLDVSSILREADTGTISRYMDLLNENRQRDCHLQSTVGTREIAASAMPWRLKPAQLPGESKPSEENARIAAECEEALRQAQGVGETSLSFTSLLAHLAGAFYYTFSVAETKWDVLPDFRLVPVGWNAIEHRRFVFSQQDGKLRWFDQGYMEDEVHLQSRYPGKFVQHQPRVNGDVAVREGLGRVVTWAALFRNWDYADWMRLAELAWKPWRMGHYEDGATDADIQNLIAALEALTTNGIGVFPKRAGMEVSWPEGGRGSKAMHAELADHLAKEISKGVLGQTLTVEAGDRGARSLGEVHDRVRRDIAEYDAMMIAITVRRDIIRPYIEYNYGTSVPVPEFEFITEDQPEIGAFARGIESIVRSGARVPQHWVRDKLGIPEPRDGDAICMGIDVLQKQPSIEGDESSVVEIDPPPPQPSQDPNEEDAPQGQPAAAA